MADEEKQMTRAQLTEALEKSEQLRSEQAAALARLEARLNAIAEVQQTQASEQVRRDVAKNLPERQRPSDKPYAHEELVPYRGWVRAITKCFIEGLHEEGDYFEVSVPSLWSDDPFVAVKKVGVKEDGSARFEDDKSAPVADFRGRMNSAERMAMARPRKASELNH